MPRSRQQDYDDIPGTFVFDAERSRQSVDEFDAFYRREYVAVHRSVLLICGSPSAAEDVVQDAFALAWGRWDEIEMMERPGAWVCRVAIRAAIKQRSRRREMGNLHELVATTGGDVATIHRSPWMRPGALFLRSSPGGEAQDDRP